MEPDSGAAALNAAYRWRDAKATNDE